MKKLLSVFLPIVVYLVSIACSYTPVEGWGSASSTALNFITYVVSLVGIDRTNGGGHTSTSDRVWRYDNHIYSHTEGNGVDCSGLGLVAGAKVGYSWSGNLRAHDLSTNNSYTSAVSNPGSDWRVGDIIGVDHNGDGNIEHIGFVSATDPDNGTIRVTHTSSSQDEVVTTAHFDPDTNNYWWGTNSGNNQHRRPPDG